MPNFVEIDTRSRDELPFFMRDPREETIDGIEFLRGSIVDASGREIDPSGAVERKRIRSIRRAVLWDEKHVLVPV